MSNIITIAVSIVIIFINKDYYINKLVNTSAYPKYACYWPYFYILHITSHIIIIFTQRKSYLLGNRLL